MPIPFNAPFVIMKSAIFWAFLALSAVGWEQFQCINYLNYPQNVGQGERFRVRTLRSHFFANTSPGTTYFSLLVLPLSSIQTSETLITRLFTWAKTYCAFRSHPHPEACVFACPTIVGYQADGVTPLKHIRFNIAANPPNIILSSAYPIKEGQVETIA